MVEAKSDIELPANTKVLSDDYTNDVLYTLTNIEESIQTAVR